MVRLNQVIEDMFYIHGYLSLEHQRCRAQGARVQERVHARTV